ncbi:MAG: glycosyltransferase family 2 protein [Chthoniobacterales bacterium]|nr:glycosyltransferase family 2 protein [Chthoniobacterales bacterium]
MNAPELSLVIPCHNEEGNLQPLLAAIRAALDPLGLNYEVVITDDFSTDKSWDILKRLAAADPRVRALRFESNCGESAATWAGMQAARGRYIATLDADLQNDPRDLPAMLKALEDADCVCGTRVATRAKGDNWIRIVSSRIANRVRNALSGENVTDAGCTYRVMRRECLERVKFFNGAHRFLPTLIKMEGFRVLEVPVSTNPRYSGRSHYGVWNRLFKSFRDLLGVRWLKSRQIRYEITESINCL